MSTDRHMRWLYETVKDEETAVQFLRKKRLLHSERRCSSCGQTMRLGRGGWTWRCFKRSCRKEISIRNGTWFDGPRHGMKLHKAVELIYWWSRELTSVKVCVNELRVNRVTAMRWCRYLRQVAADALALAPVQLGGPGELLWAQFKRGNKRRCGTHRSALPLYLSELMWRKRVGASDAFDAILDAILTLHPPRVDSPQALMSPPRETVEPPRTDRTDRLGFPAPEIG